MIYFSQVLLEDNASSTALLQKRIIPIAWTLAGLSLLLLLLLLPLLVSCLSLSLSYPAPIYARACLLACACSRNKMFHYYCCYHYSWRENQSRDRPVQRTNYTGGDKTSVYFARESISSSALELPLLFKIYNDNDKQWRPPIQIKFSVHIENARC